MKLKIFFPVEEFEFGITQTEIQFKGELGCYTSNRIRIKGEKLELESVMKFLQDLKIQAQIKTSGKSLVITGDNLDTIIQFISYETLCQAPTPENINIKNKNGERKKTKFFGRSPKKIEGDFLVNIIASLIKEVIMAVVFKKIF